MKKEHLITGFTTFGLVLAGYWWLAGGDVTTPNQDHKPNKNLQTPFSTDENKDTENSEPIKPRTQSEEYEYWLSRIQTFESKTNFSEVLGSSLITAYSDKNKITFTVDTNNSTIPSIPNIQRTYEIELQKSELTEKIVLRIPVYLITRDSILTGMLYIFIDPSDFDSYKIGTEDMGEMDRADAIYSQGS